jgi:hypothetical protein
VKKNETRKMQIAHGTLHSSLIWVMRYGIKLFYIDLNTDIIFFQFRWRISRLLKKLLLEGWMSIYIADYGLYNYTNN